MAFVFQADRKLSNSVTSLPHETANWEHLGPGTYTKPIEQTKQQAQKSVPEIPKNQPFGAHTGRPNQLNPEQSYGMIESTYGQGINAATPGPGHYEAPLVGFNKMEHEMQISKQMKPFEMHKFGVQVVQKTAAFANKQPRFEDKNEVKYMQIGHMNPTAEDPETQVKGVPGPGQYDIQSQFKGKTSSEKIADQMSTQTQSYLASVIAPNAPSIPSHENVFGYQEDSKGQLVKQKNQEPHLSGVGDEKAGPGQYFVDKTIDQSKIAGPLAQYKHPHQKSKRVQILLKEKLGRGTGPGSYIKVDTPLDQSKIKPTSAFLSGVTKSESLVSMPSIRSQKKGLGGKPHGQRMRTVQNEQVAQRDVILDDDDDQITPGPGSYRAQSCFMQSRQINRSQNFGSQVRRFTEGERSQTACANMGPGVYDVINASQYQSQSRPKTNQYGFNSSLNRWSKSVSLKDLNEVEVAEISIPGPGTYIQPTSLEQLKNRVQGKNGVFGSTERRFVHQENMKTPGPGHYDQELAYGSKTSISANVALVQERSNAQQAMISQSKRDTTDKRKSFTKKSRQILQYDSDSFTIQNNLRKKLEAVNNHMFDTQGGFIVAQKRSKLGKGQGTGSDSFIGPGYYEAVQSSFDNSKKQKSYNMKSQQVLHKSLVMSHSKSMTRQQSSAAQITDGSTVIRRSIDNPGPGAYNTNVPGQAWFKRSYNMQFTEP